MGCALDRPCLVVLHAQRGRIGLSLMQMRRSRSNSPRGWAGEHPSGELHFTKQKLVHFHGRSLSPDLWMKSLEAGVPRNGPLLTRSFG